ncbi:MAG: hypothetical protein ACKO1M_01860 [Planctomycetota bacterium]
MIVMLGFGAWTKADDGRVPGSLDVLLGPSQPTADDSADVADPATRMPVRGPAAPPPAPEQTEAAKTKIREAFSAELGVVRAGGERGTLVIQLLEIVDQPDLAAAERYAAAEVAIELAMGGDDPQLLCDAVVARADWFTGQDRLAPLLDFAVKLHDESRGDPAVATDFSLEVSRDAVRAGQPAIAVRAAENAQALLNKLPANDADRFRPAIQRQVAEANEMCEIWTAADRAKVRLEAAPEDAVAHVWLAFRRAWEGSWTIANEHFRKGNHAGLKAAALVESQLVEGSAPEEVLESAGNWWEAVAADETPPNILDGDPPPSPSPMMQQIIRQHAADLYHRSLKSEPGLASPIDRKLAESRVAASQAERKQGMVSLEKRVQADTPIAGPEQKVGDQGFNEQAFAQAEATRTNLSRRLRGAVATGDPRVVARIHRDLIENRRQWCQSLYLYNRDESLPRKQQLVADILRRDSGAADVWLCDCYLKILDGKREPALESLNRADKLMSEDPARQLFCGRQLLDAGAAALMLGERDRAEKLIGSDKTYLVQMPQRIATR